MTGATYQEFKTTDVHVIQRFLDISDLLEEVKQLAAAETKQNE